MTKFSWNTEKPCQKKWKRGVMCQRNVYYIVRTTISSRVSERHVYCFPKSHGVLSSTGLVWKISRASLTETLKNRETWVGNLLEWFVARAGEGALLCCVQMCWHWHPSWIKTYTSPLAHSTTTRARERERTIQTHHYQGTIQGLQESRLTNKRQSPPYIDMSRELEDRGVARVTFRVRCETLGYGESVFLYPEATNRRVSDWSHCIVKHNG